MAMNQNGVKTMSGVGHRDGLAWGGSLQAALAVEVSVCSITFQGFSIGGYMFMHQCAACGFRTSQNVSACPDCGSGRLTRVGSGSTTSASRDSLGLAPEAEVVRLLAEILERQRMAVILQEKTVRNTNAIKWGIAMLFFGLVILPFVFAALVASSS